MKKKIVSICSILTLLTVFFCIPVYAENTYVREIRNYSNSISSVSFTYSATAAQFDYVTESTLSGGMYSPVLITVRFTNNGSNDIKIANSYVDLTFTTYSELSGYDCYTSDLMVQMVKNGNDTPRYNIVASNDYSYGGHIIIPSNSSLYLVFEVDIAAHYDTSSAQVVSPSLDAVLVSVNSSDVVAGDYPTTGSIPEQLDQLESYVSQVAGYTYGNGQSLATITSLLIDIKNQIRFTGTFVAPSMDQYSSNSVNVNLASPFVNFTLRRTIYPSYLITYDFEDNYNTNSFDTYGTKRYVIEYYGQFRLENSITYNLFLLDHPYVDSNSVRGYVASVESNFVETTYTTSSGIFLISNGSTSNRFIIPGGRNYFRIIIYVDVPLNTTLTPVNLDSDTSVSVTTIETYTGYYPHSIAQGMADIYSVITSPSQQNTDTVTESNSVGSMSDQIHQQEQQWYAQNDAAMEAVGLSNYRYTQNQQNGIVGAVLQFEQLWLALGDWTLVYIFTLMLSLAVFILRHEPTTRVKQARELEHAFYRENTKPSKEFVQRVRKFNGK